MIWTNDFWINDYWTKWHLDKWLLDKHLLDNNNGMEFDGIECNMLFVGCIGKILTLGNRSRSTSDRDDWGWTRRTCPRSRNRRYQLLWTPHWPSRRGSVFTLILELYLKDNRFRAGRRILAPWAKVIYSAIQSNKSYQTWKFLGNFAKLRSNIL